MLQFVKVTGIILLISYFTNFTHY